MLQSGCTSIDNVDHWNPLLQEVLDTMKEVLSTDSVTSASKLSYWVDAICATYVELECDSPVREAFHGHIVNHRLPCLDVSVVQSNAQTVARTKRKVAQSSSDCFLVSLQTKGMGVIEQDGRRAILQPGDFALYDSTRPYCLQFTDDFEEIVLRLRRDALQAQLRHVERLTSTAVSGRVGAGLLLSRVLEGLCREVDCVKPASAAAVAEGVVQMVVAGIQSLPACHTIDPTALSAYHLARARQLMQQRLRDPALTLQTVADGVGISVGHLHRLFKSEPLSAAQYLWRKRLEACSRELIDPQLERSSISEIAYSWGFNDAAHFSRAFRQCFGHSPRTWREMNLRSRKIDFQEIGNRTGSIGLQVQPPL